MLGQITIELNNERMKDAHRAANQHRLASQAQAGHIRKLNVRKRLGQTLVNIGQTLLNQ